MNRRDFLKSCAAVGAGGFVLSNQVVEVRAGAERPNILLITTDDMNYDSPGVCGCGISDITPNIDHLAAEGLRFTHSHINCRLSAEPFDPDDRPVSASQWRRGLRTD